MESLRLIAADIKLAHSVFAMPFALLAAFMAALGTRTPVDSDIDPFWLNFGGQLGLIVACMFLARTCAMVSNRIIDREIDARNPRTEGRALASGRVALSRATLVLLLCAMLFMAACVCFGRFYANWWPAILGMPVLAWICAYGWLKRYTSLCHIYLGSSLAMSPIAAAIAIEPATIVPWSWAFQPALWLLSAMVLCWVAGFDIIYALQDVEVDRAQGLHSAPGRMGQKSALRVARLLHATAVAALVLTFVVDHRLQILFATGILAVAILLIYEHATVSRWGTTRMALAFFTLNGLISCTLGALGILDVLW